MDRISAWVESGLTTNDFQVVDQLTHPSGEIALRFWRERPADGLRMGRDVPSRAIAPLLSRVIVYEPIDGGEDFRVHLAGSGTVRRFGRDITGERFSRLFAPEDVQIRRQILHDVTVNGEPRMMHVRHSAGSVEVLRLELLQIPVIAPNGVDRWALTFSFYF
ncbi:hypothetical protein FHS83_003693 [Rhizomicrobium palustre]|uniref:PAS domain-containing protein n=1 Tax=Rhizomicrobium palustre TaxID=189966 RepID=A0A846N4H5_9PROT|nr:PAS domain-containing protein [Rhizomicrobium palustre]NIK90375.1 hypothetical protein [Rhizomicrobium palustre]